MALVCLIALAVGLSMAVVSIAKLLLVLGGVLFLLLPRKQLAANASGVQHSLSGFAFVPVILLMLAALSLSLLWTTAYTQEALVALAKYGKLLLIPLLLLLIQSRREAHIAMGCFIASQVFLMTSSWLLYGGLPLFWASSNLAKDYYAVFSSYLDQGIMAAVLAAICWHGRCLAPGKYGRFIAIFIAIAAMLNVFFVLIGRSGHMVAILLLSVAIMWQLPKKVRLLVLLLPFLIVLALFFTSNAVQQRLSLVKSEIQTYSPDKPATTSTGIRLQLWNNALDIMGQHPLTGAGIGSWTPEYNQRQLLHNPAHVPIQPNGNPHQEYLMWGVQLGFPGLVLLLAFFASLLRDSMAFSTPHARALQSTLLALMVACCFNSTLYDSYIGDFFCVALGLLLAMGKANLPTQSKPTISRPMLYSASPRNATN